MCSPATEHVQPSPILVSLSRASLPEGNGLPQEEVPDGGGYANSAKGCTGNPTDHIL